MRPRLLTVAVATMLAGWGVARACSTFVMEDGTGRVFGKNYDWDVADGLVIVNKRGMAKRALTEGTGKAAEWVSRYGSVTFNQYGRELPCGGMNEAGLVIELMWLDETVYAAPDARPAVSNLQWIQYQLDVADSVEEVIASDASVRIESSGTARVHYLVADRSGAVAAIEVLQGKMVVHAGADLPVPALTNDTYDASLAFLEGLPADGTPSTGSSLHRFVRAARACAGAASAAPAPARLHEHAFTVLDDIAQEDYTIWQIVYDMTEGRVYFRTRDARETRFIDFDALDFDCTSPPRILDMNAAHANDVSEKLVAYTRAANIALVRGAFRQTEFLRSTPETVIRTVGVYPDRTRCTGSEWVDREAVEAAVIAEHNLARTDPQRYARFLEEWRGYFRGKRLELPGRGTIATEEGVKALEEAIVFLRDADSLPKLRPSPGLARAARDHVRDTGPVGTMGHAGSDGSEPADRVRRYGKWSGRVGENIAYGGMDAREFVIRLIVDDGVADRGHRANVFNPRYRLAGVAFDWHREYGTMCVITYAAGFEALESTGE
jgi:choloylglycine hydrolase